MTKAETALAKVRHYRAELAKAERAEQAARKRLHEWITKAVDAGVSSAEVARVAGVSRGRVSQVAPVANVPQPPIHAQKNASASVCVNDPATVPALPATPAGALSGIASVRQRRPYGKRTRFLSVVGRTLADVLDGAPEGRTYLVGPPPVDASGGATRAEQVRAWALADPGPGWSGESHYLADPDLPVLRFRHADGRRVTIMRAAAWWGETDADVATCAAAWEGLGRALDAVPAFAGAGLADTPATTGRALWLRTIPEGRNYPVLSAELRELIAATSGQGRIQRLDPPAGTSSGESFAYLDGRFMYAALTWGMPVGEPIRHSGTEVDGWDAREWTSNLRGRGRWRITATVPEGWDHVGMFAAPSGGGWVYPDQSGQRFTTWADGSEVWAAMERGWEPKIHEGITWAEGKPLDVWRDALVKVWATANASEAPAARLGAKAVRQILVSTLGAFATRAHPVTRSTGAEDAAAVPAGAEVRRVGDRLVWTEQGSLSAWSEQTSHVEWAATVWARARTRLLTARGVGQERVGALTLPRDRIVAFSTDALYLAGGAPGWADDGAPGRFRVKGHRPGAFAWPTSWAEVYRLRDEAEAAGHGQ